MKRKPFTGTPTNKSISARLYRHSLGVFLLSAILCGVLLVTVLLFARIYNGVVNTSYYLEDFVDQVDRIQSLVIHAPAGLSQEEQGEILQENEQRARHDLSSLENVSVPGNYTRNVADIHRMYNAFTDCVQTLDTLGSSESASVEYMTDYERMNQLSRSIQIRRQIIYSELSVYQSQKRERILWDIRILIALMIGMMILSLMTLLDQSSVLSGEITQPLNTLTGRAEEIQRGNLEDMSFADTAAVPKTVEGTEPPVEIVTLNTAFDVMLAKIQEQFTQLKESMRLKDKLREKEMENLRVSNLLATSQLQCLQMQINPHFLFNTLNMIQQTVYLEQPEKTSYLLKQTAAFLRYSLDYAGKSVTLQQELEALGNYVSLQEERMGERILYEFDLDETINSLKVPALILQPLVENSLIHGLSDRPKGGVISIITRYDRERRIAVLQVTDNGHGLNDRQLAQVRESMENSDGIPDRRIGLSNIRKRIRLMYPSGSDLRIESRPDQETDVMIEVPFAVPAEKRGLPD